MKFLIINCFFLSLLAFLQVYANSYSDLTVLVERVFDQNDSKSVLFVGRNEQFLSEFSKTHSSIPVMFLSEWTVEFKKINDGTVLVVLLGDIKVQENFLRLIENSIESLENRKYVIVFVDTYQNIEYWFSFFKEHSFKRIFGITYSDGISYFYTPHYPKKIHKISKDDVVLPNMLNYFQGFNVRSNFIRHFPMTFVYPDKNGLEQIGGISGQVFRKFLEKHKAIYKEVQMENLTKFHFWEILTAAYTNKIDLSVNVFSLVEPLVNNPEFNNIDASAYSGKMDKYRILVAINGYVEPSEYFVRPFDGLAWICIGLTLIYITILDIVWKKCCKLTVDIWNSFSQIFLITLSASPERPITSAYRIHAQVSLFAFIIGNIYVIYFTSYLTVHIPIAQYDSVQDLIDNNISLMVSRSKWAWHKTRVEYSPSLEQVLVPAEYKTIFEHILPMKNKSVAHLLNSDEAEFYLDIHSRFTKPTFRIAEEAVFPDYFLSFVMPRHTPLKEIVDLFTLQTMETGLKIKWNSDLVHHVLATEFRMYLNKTSDVIEIFKPLTVEHFIFVWKLLAVGLSLATGVFCGEFVWHYFLNKRNSFENELDYTK